jgi:hypothetical protein
MAPYLGIYQAHDTPGFIFGCVAGPLFVLGNAALLYVIGRRGNDKYKYSRPSRMPKLVALWRLACFVFGLVLVGFGVHNQGRWYLAWFTQWNWTVICLYFAAGLVVSGFRITAPQQVPVFASDADAERLAGPERSTAARVVFTLHHLLGELCVPSALLVFLVVWFYLEPYEHWDNAREFTNISVHSMNVLMTLVDWSLAGWRFNPRHFPLVALWPALYSLWHLIANAAWGMMCYPFMQTDKVSSIIAYLGMLTAFITIFFVFYALDLVKHRFCSCCLVRPTLLSDDDLSGMDKGGKAGQGTGPAEAI